MQNYITFWSWLIMRTKWIWILSILIIELVFEFGTGEIKY